VFAHGLAEVRVGERIGEVPDAVRRTMLALHVETAVVPVPGLHANLWYVRRGPDPFAPSDQRFGGEVLLSEEASLESCAAFNGLWAQVCARHPAILVEHRPRGIVFELRGEDPEGAFHFVRDVGRAVLGAYVPLVEAGRH
jgi:coproporphyrinogen III oxidase